MKMFVKFQVSGTWCLDKIDTSFPCQIWVNGQISIWM